MIQAAPPQCLTLPAPDLSPAAAKSDTAQLLSPAPNLAATTFIEPNPAPSLALATRTDGVRAASAAAASTVLSSPVSSPVTHSATAASPGIVAGTDGTAAPCTSVVPSVSDAAAEGEGSQVACDGDRATAVVPSPPISSPPAIKLFNPPADGQCLYHALSADPALNSNAKDLKAQLINHATKLTPDELFQRGVLEEATDAAKQAYTEKIELPTEWGCTSEIVLLVEMLKYKYVVTKLNPQRSPYIEVIPIPHPAGSIPTHLSPSQSGLHYWHEAAAASRGHATHELVLLLCDNDFQVVQYVDPAGVAHRVHPLVAGETDDAARARRCSLLQAVCTQNKWRMPKLDKSEGQCGTKGGSGSTLLTMRTAGHVLNTAQTVGRRLFL